MVLSLRRSCRANLSSFDRLDCVLEMPCFIKMLFTLERRSSASLLCKLRQADSTAVTISTTGILLEVTAKLSPFESTRVSVGFKTRLEKFLTHFEQHCSLSAGVSALLLTVFRCNVWNFFICLDMQISCSFCCACSVKEYTWDFSDSLLCKISAMFSITRIFCASIAVSV